MKRRLFALLLAAVVLLAAVPLQARAASDVCFVSINDTLPETIPFAYLRSSVVYIPSSALSSFRIYTLYDANIATVLVYTSSQQVTIDMNTGTATDRDGMEYSATAIYRNGQVYLPAQFICSMFGLGVSYIEGVGYGDICRITDGSQVLGDALFLSAATNQMRVRYNAYLDSITPATDSSHTGNNTQNSHEDARVYLTFTGLPTAYLMNLLKNYAITAAFFLTAQDIASAPDTVRRIVGEGHTVGICCPDGTLDSVEAAMDLLFEAAHVRTVLVTAGENESQAFLDACSGAGYVACRYDINGINGGAGISDTGQITGRINQVRGSAVLTLALTSSNDAAVRATVYYLYSNNFGLGVIREVGYTGGTNRVR